MRIVILGAGEVGSSLDKVISRYDHEVFLLDQDAPDVDNVDVLNICFPYHAGFVDTVTRYIERYNPWLTIVHSTVPVGTTRAIGPTAVHSPVHGVHPNIDQGLRTFVKYVGGSNQELVYRAQELMWGWGIRAKAVSSPEVSELSKILCTSYYAWNVIYCKEVQSLCGELGVPFEEVYGWNEHYNEGYRALGRPEVTRPLLKPMEGAIGGHCLIPNAKLLRSWITDTILGRNERYNAIAVSEAVQDSKKRRD